MRNAAFTLAVSLAMASAAVAQAPDAEQDDAKSIRTTLFQQAEAYKFESRAKDADPVELNLHERSLLNWTNPLRAADVGIIVIWEDEGLPLAFGTLFNRGPTHMHSLTSLSEFPLHATYQDKTAWTPTPGVTWQKWEGNPNTVAPSKAVRMVQMRAIARQFEVRHRSGQAVKNLRLMPEPLHRFKSEKHKVVDGAILAFAEGTDAETMIILRADETDQSWKFACARCGYFEMTALVDERVVWKVDPVRSTNARTGVRQYRTSPYISSISPISQARSVSFDDREAAVLLP